MSDAQQWSELARGNTATIPAEPVSPQAGPPPEPPANADGKGRRRRKEKAPKPPKAERAPKPSRSRASGGTTAGIPLFALDEKGPNRQQLEQEAAAELTAAIAPSLEILRSVTPDAASPEDAYRKIESRLDQPVQDRDAGIPDHPIYSGDALVYYQLRRHYGSPNPGGTYHRTWYPGGQ